MRTRWRCDPEGMILTPTFPTLLANPHSHRQTAISGRSYGTPMILFPSPEIGTSPQPNYPECLNPLPPVPQSPDTLPRQPAPILALLNQSTHLPLTSVLLSLPLFVFSVFSFTSFLRHSIYSRSVNTCRVRGWHRRYLGSFRCK